MKELSHWINGQHVKGTSGRFADVINPATGEVQSKCPMASVSETEAAIAVATPVVEGFADVYAHHWLEGMRAKVPPGNGAPQEFAILETLSQAKPSGPTNVGRVIQLLAPRREPLQLGPPTLRAAQLLEDLASPVA